MERFNNWRDSHRAEAGDEADVDTDDGDESEEPREGYFARRWRERAERRAAEEADDEFYDDDEENEATPDESAERPATSGEADEAPRESDDESSAEPAAVPEGDSHFGVTPEERSQIDSMTDDEVVSLFERPDFAEQQLDMSLGYYSYLLDRHTHILEERERAGE